MIVVPEAIDKAPAIWMSLDPPNPVTLYVLTFARFQATFPEIVADAQTLTVLFATNVLPFKYGTRFGSTVTTQLAANVLFVKFDAEGLVPRFADALSVKPPFTFA